MAISTASIFGKSLVAFATYWINIESIQNTYQIDLFPTLETKKIDPTCISDTVGYDKYRIQHGVEQ